ncbi:MAG: multiubiquitin domain-containing protein [Deltaproteobacteria bacterium]|nr:multiubiquitin domain-containing protein [Deltaproteobacteria bacterium]
MSTPDIHNATSSDGPGHTKEVQVFVNSRPKTVSEKEISYAEIVKLAFADAFQNPNTLYTVTYRYADGDKRGGSMVEGDTIKVKKEMQFNVQFSTRS